jgi:adenine-specific DNA-methyltransferase
MALIDDLIGRITEAQLKDELTQVIADLRKNQRFGLVFENHIPETVALPGLPIVTGALVRPRSSDDGSIYRVESLNGTKANIVNIEDNNKEAVAKKELRVIRRFGDPIYPTLDPVEAVQAGKADRPHHAVISGENFHALQLLVYVYEGQVDCIYIDPPYNSGARDWKYNNCYVDKKDTWRHSKWLSFMQKRLSLAKRLMKPDGVLVVTIDKNEHSHLTLLLEQQFPEYELTSVCIVHNPRGAQGDNFSHTNEFAIFATPKNQQVISERSLQEGSLDVTGSVSLADPDSVEGSAISIKIEAHKGTAALGKRGRFKITAVDENGGDPLRNWGGESSRWDAKNCFYPILVKNNEIIGFGDVPADNYNPPHHVERRDGIIEIWPIDNNCDEKKWRYARQSVEEIREKLSVRQVSGVPQIYLTKTTGKHKTVWYGPRYDANTYGTKIVKKLTGNDFPFPKSVLAVRDTLFACVGHLPNALILDFFAGSGTTFHATCMLNEEDGGSRRSILVTNNEVSEQQSKALRRRGFYPDDKEYEQYGIFESVTVPRCKSVVTGKDPTGNNIEGELLARPLSKGYEENIEFFRLKYLDPDQIDLGTQFEVILPLLWLSAGGMGAREASSKGGYSMPKGSIYAVLLDERRFTKFREALKSRPDIKKVWLVTDSDEAFGEMRSELPRKINVSMLYRDYLRTFTINTRLML